MLQGLLIKRTVLLDFTFYVYFRHDVVKFKIEMPLIIATNETPRNLTTWVFLFDLTTSFFQIIGN